MTWWDMVNTKHNLDKDMSFQYQIKSNFIIESKDFVRNTILVKLR